MLILWVLLAAGDIITTHIALKRGDAEEAMAVPRFLFSIAPPLLVMIVLKLIGLGILWYLIVGHASGWLDVARWAVVTGMLAFGVYAIINNIRVLRE